jgi:hypothetical protein
MEENFYNDDFEKFLQDQVKHHKMFPADRIWRNIHAKIHQDYKWPALTVVALAFLTATIAVSVYFSPGPNIFAVNSSSQKYKQTNSLGTSSPILKTTYKVQRSGLANSFVSSLSDNVADEILSDNSQLNSLTTAEDSDNNSILRSTITKEPVELYTPPLQAGIRILENDIVINQHLQSGEVNETINTELISNTHEHKIIGKTALLHENFAFPIPISKNRKTSKFDYTVYITPSASYRSLKEDKNAILKQSSNVGGPIAINYISDVNQVVRHKPGTGMEAGVSLGYNLTSKLKLKTGLQINARQYSIEAFLSTNDLATIAYFSGGRIDSLVAFSSYRVSGGYESTELENRYYQVSIPIGLEYEVAGNKNIQLKIAAAIQPTYMISDNAFLISTDFKNYIESPEMTRKWNMNANVETFLSIKSGSYKWQFGPQFRYQLRPTSLDKYPIREYLMDYGVKIGVTKSLQ